MVKDTKPKDVDTKIVRKPRARRRPSPPKPSPTLSNRSVGSRIIKREWVLFALLIPGLLSALIIGARRYAVESGNRNVELVLDYSEIQNLSVASGTSIPELLTKFKSAGVTGIAVTEDLLQDLASTGQVAFEERFLNGGPVTIIDSADSRLSTRAYRSLVTRLPENMVFQAVDERSGVPTMPYKFAVKAAPGTLNLIGLGLSPDTVWLVKQAGLDVVARLQNNPALTKKAVDADIADLKRDDVKRIIFSGEEVLGFRGLVPYAADQMRSNGLIYGSIEMGKQKGDARMSEALKSELIRVHSISLAEMAGMSPGTAIERFARAVKERNIRLCYVHLPETAGEAPVLDGVDFVNRIKGQVEAAGYRMGTAQPFRVISRPKPLLVLMALAVAAGVVLLLGSLVTLSPKVKYGLLALAFIGLAGLALIGGMGLKLAALTSALVFPTLGVVALIGPLLKSEGIEEKPAKRAALLFLGMSAFSLCGALLIVGLLNDRPFMVKVDQFAGIKAAHLLPIMGVIFMMAAGLPIFGKPFGQVWADIKENLRRVVANPLFVWHAIAVVIGLGIVGFALLRTGNDPGVGVSGIELKFRSLLDHVMGVRPRTKEFMVGHPAMILGTALLLTRRRAWGLSLIALGVLGQVSLLNTFCHIHTPLQVTVFRAFNGLVLGLIFGMVAWMIFGKPKHNN